MKRYALVLASVIAVGARADTPILQTEALTQFDVQVSSDDLSIAFGSGSANIEPGLDNIANSTTTQPSVRVRAISTLASYCASSTANGCASGARQTVLAIVQSTSPAYSQAQSGSDLLVFRAALEALGSVGDPIADCETIASSLTHPSRDIRTSAARALKNLQATCAIGALRTRYQQESTDQVRFAINDALTVLAALPSPPTCTCNP